MLDDVLAIGFYHWWLLMGNCSLSCHVCCNGSIRVLCDMNSSYFSIAPFSKEAIANLMMVSLTVAAANCNAASGKIRRGGGNKPLV